MRLKNRHQPIRPVKNTSSDLKHHSNQGVVDAVIFHPRPDVSFYLSLLNLLNFFVDSINHFPVAKDITPQQADHLTRSVTSINLLYRDNASLLNDELQKLFTEFIDDSENFSDTIQALAATEQDLHSVHKSTLTHIIGQISHLQWLAVCIMQEMKLLYVHA